MIDLMLKSKASFWYQKNNLINPNIACNVTSCCNCLDILHKTDILNNIDKQYRVGDQQEDWLYKYLCDDNTIQKFLLKSHGTTEIPSPEWADCLIYGINTLAGMKICYFDEILSLNDIISDLKSDKPVNISTTLYGGGHRISIVGCRNENVTDETLDLMIADPWKHRNEGGIRFIRWNELNKIRKQYGIRFT